MPKVKKAVAKPSKKQKLSPAERSQIAKDRWAKIRKAKEDKTIADVSNLHLEMAASATAAIMEEVSTPAPPLVEHDKIAVESSGINGTGATVTIIDQPPLPVAPPVEVPAPQLAPVKAPKPKRYTGPKEFSVALKAAENRLAKAIVERAQAAGQLAALNAEIPSLLGIINALKGSGTTFNPAPAPNFIANDFQGNYFPNALSGGPNPAPVDPMDAIRAAMAAPPVSRAIGNAVQLPPDVVGNLEGPDDDDNEDKFITGPLAGGGWK